MAAGAQTVRHSSPWLREAQSPSTTQAEINDTRAAQSPEEAQGQAHVQAPRGGRLPIRRAQLWVCSFEGA